MNISLPDEMKAWAERRVASGSFANVSDYVRDLIRQDQDDQERLRVLRAALEVGETSGESSLSMEKVFEGARAKARSRRPHG